jgi:hypothetical protein
MEFTDKDDGPSIEEFLKSHKSIWKERWKFPSPFSFREDVGTWWYSLDLVRMMTLSNKAIEKLLLYR